MKNISFRAPVKKLVSKVFSSGVIGLIVLSAVTIAFKRPDGQLNNLLSKLENFRSNYVQEKVYLQLDKPLYSINEDIWFKGYVVTAENNELSATSKVLYVDLIDAQDSVRQSLLLPLKDGLTTANLHLSTALETGTYRICAYTKWMENFSSDFFFYKEITIVNGMPGAYNGELTYETQNTKSGRRLSAGIKFRTSDGLPAVAKTVAYTVYADNASILTGKALTDTSGRVTITGYIKESYKNSLLKIHTSFIKNNQVAVEQNFIIKPLSATADVQFFPEGGRLVNGIRTKVAFKAIRPDGSSEKISGKIVDNDDNELIYLQSEHAGMGIFALQPQARKTYTAIVKHEDGSEGRYLLPKADDSGYVLNINGAGKDSLSVRVSASAGLADGREAILIGQSSGETKFVARIKLSDIPVFSYVPLSRFRAGIIQFTLFTPDYQPVAERLVFCERNDHLKATLITDKQIYNKREKTKVTLIVSDKDNKPVVGSFAVSVTPVYVKTDEDKETDILVNLLLTSDIIGRVEQPGYYFNATHTNRQKHLDYLMLTQGWRRFSWTELQDDKYPHIKFKPEQGLSIAGTITTLSGKPVPNGKVTLFGKSLAGPILIDTIADKNGRFQFTQLDFSDSAKVIVKATNIKHKNTVRIIIDDKPQRRYKTEIVSSGPLKADVLMYQNYAASQFKELSKYGLLKNAIALKEVKIKDRKLNVFEERKYVPHSASLNPGRADIVLKPDKLSRYTDLGQVFYGLAGVEVAAGGIKATRSANKSLTAPNPTMQIILDGTFIPKDMAPAFLKATNPNDIAGIELLLGGSAAIYGNDGFFGVMVITTKRGGEDYVPREAPNLAKFSPQGYSVSKEFYSPVYQTSAKDSGMTDLRSTIYWNPNVVTGADGKTSFDFYNADAVGTYKVTLEGLDTHGNLAHKIYTYTVK